jgi:hypothetical protein
MSLLRGLARKQKRKKSISFFPAHLFFNPLQCVAQNAFVHLRICTPSYLCLPSAVPRQGTWLHCQEYWFSTKKTPFIERYFFASKNSFSLTASGTRIISFLCPIREASSVFVKANYSLSSELFSPKNLLHAAAVAQRYPRGLLCAVDSIRAWRQALR